tara:strand:- start:3067 stop:3273 length:207 start_codon:yes stop_codon:yes gene_type:complete
MTQEVKDKIRDLEREKITLEDQLEFVGSNVIKMTKIEEQIFEIEDTIKKLTKDGQLVENEEDIGWWGS